MLTNLRDSFPQTKKKNGHDQNEEEWCDHENPYAHQGNNDSYLISIAQAMIKIFKSNFHVAQ